MTIPAVDNQKACVSPWLTNDKSFETNEIIKIEDQEYKFIDLNKIKVGEYTSIKTLAEGKNIYDAMLDILTILIRPVIDGKIEKYDPDKSESRKDLFNKKLINGVSGV